jgi:hypothetical protein
MTVEHIGLAPAHLARGTRIDQHHLKAPAIEQLKERNPVHPGRLHRHGLDLQRGQPIGKCLQIIGEARETAHRFLTQIRIHRHPLLTTADVDPRTVGVNHSQPLPFLLACHHSPSHASIDRRVGRCGGEGVTLPYEVTADAVPSTTPRRYRTGHSPTRVRTHQCVNGFGSPRASYCAPS